MVGGEQGEARAGQLDSPHFDVSLEVEVVEVQHGEESGVGPPTLQIGVQVEALEPFGEQVRHQASSPFVEIAHDQLRSLYSPVVDPLGETRSLVPPLEQCRAEVHVVELECSEPDVDRHPVGVARLACLPRQIHMRVVVDGVSAEHDVAELVPPQLPGRSHDPAHAELGAQLLGVTGSRTPGPDDLLEGNQVWIDRREHFCYSFGSLPAVQADGPVDVVGDDAQVDRPPRGVHVHMIVPGECQMGRLRTEYEVACPCCGSTLVIDEGLRRVVRHQEVERADKPKLDEAQRILAEQKARRDALFEQAVESEKTRGDALSKRFEEALKEASKEPVVKPTRGFDLD